VDPARDVPSAFDAIASAALSAPPAPAPGFALGGGPADLPVPKGGLPPEVVAAQRADALRANVSASSPPFRPTPPETEAPPAGSRPRLPAQAAAAPASAAVPLPGSAAPPPHLGGGPASGMAAYPVPGGDPWRSPAVPALPGAASAPPASFIRTSHLPGGSAEAPRPASAVGGAAVSPFATTEIPRPFDEEHYRAVYNDFVASKARLGESVEAITFDGFRTKLRTSEQQLLERHGCRAVRFMVIVKDRTVSLRPQLVR
jgi:hypothetical protein